MLHVAWLCVCPIKPLHVNLWNISVAILICTKRQQLMFVLLPPCGYTIHTEQIANYMLKLSMHPSWFIRMRMSVVAHVINPTQRVHFQQTPQFTINGWVGLGNTSSRVVLFGLSSREKDAEIALFTWRGDDSGHGIECTVAIAAHSTRSHTQNTNKYTIHSTMLEVMQIRRQSAACGTNDVEWMHCKRTHIKRKQHAHKSQFNHCQTELYSQNPYARCNPQLTRLMCG